MANTREPVLQPIPILSLRPTQMTVGMREVKEKRKRWRDHKSKKKRAELLGTHMIPVVLGPDQHYYVGVFMATSHLVVVSVSVEQASCEDAIKYARKAKPLPAKHVNPTHLSLVVSETSFPQCP